MPKLHVPILLPFQDLFLGKLKAYRELIYFSGRGLGKTKSIVSFLFLEALKDRKNIICLREFDKSQKYSLINEFSELIYQFNINANIENYIIESNVLSEVVRMKVYEITFYNGSKIMFRGISNSTIWGLKSLSNIDYAFYDECHNITELIYNVLVPTIRNENSQIIFSFNPQNETDFIYKKALHNLENPNDYTYVKFGSWRDNALFPNVLNRDRLKCLQENTQDVYNWIWEGKPLKDYESIINTSLIGFYDESINYKYSKIFITMDTAYTKNTSADYSVIALFGVIDNELHILRILRGHWEFGELSTNLIYMYNYALEKYKKNIKPIIIEEKGSGISLIQELRKNTHLNMIKSVKPTTDKWARLSLVLHKLSTLRIPLDRTNILNSWIDIFLNEAKEFRKDLKHKHDDIIDCVVYALQYVEDSKKQVSYSEIMKKLKY